MKVALLTMDGVTELAKDGEIPLEEALQERGAEFTWVPWSANIDWNVFDIALIRTTWDYQARYSEFIDALESIEKSTCRLINPLTIVKWNSDKSYLFELEKKGIDIVPTKRLAVLHLEEAFSYFGCEEVVVKPTISASAHNTFLIHKNNIEDVQKKVSSIDKVFLIQPKIGSVQEKGEYSLHFFDSSFSHAVLKKPKAGDFRSQEEYGSDIQRVNPPHSHLEMSKKILALLPNLTYARVDLVENELGRPMLMELELIEPCLYFTYAQEATGTFLQALMAFK